MENTLQVELVTPEKLLFSGAANMVEAPGVEGDFGVLPQHAPLVSLLNEGTVTLHLGNEQKAYRVSGGTAEVNEKGMVILAESAEEIAA